MPIEAVIITITVLSILLLYVGSTLGLSYVVLAIILIRPSCDPLFGFAKMAVGGEAGPGAAANILMIALALWYFLQRPAVVGASTLPMWAGFLVVACISAVLSPEPIAAAKGLGWLATYLAIFSVPFALTRSPEWAMRCLTAALCSSFIPVAYAFFELAFGSIGIDSASRLQSTFGHPNIFAFYLVAVLALSMFLLKSSQVALSPNVRRLLILYLPILVFLIVLTKTRSAWAASALLVSVFVGIVDRRYLALLVFLPLMMLVPGVEERILNVGSTDLDYRYHSLDSYEWRQLLWDNTLDWMAANPAPLLGHGLNSFAYYAPIFFPLARDTQGVGAHNTFLQIYFEMGILGILTFAWLFLSLFWKLKAGYRFDKAGTVIVMALALAYLVECYSDNLLDYLVYQWFFWFLMGAICAWNQLRSKAPVLQPALAI